MLFRSLAREAGVAEHVEILGELDDVRGLLSVADAFLLPSAQESFGLAALEAMACGVPVVASRVGGLPEVIDHGLTGYLHPPDALDDMADSAVALLTDEARRKAMGKEATSRVHEKYCEERILPMYEECYRRLIEAKVNSQAV